MNPVHQRRVNRKRSRSGKDIDNFPPVLSGDLCTSNVPVLQPLARSAIEGSVRLGVPCRIVEEDERWFLHLGIGSCTFSPFLWPRGENRLERCEIAQGGRAVKTGLVTASRNCDGVEARHVLAIVLLENIGIPVLA